MSVSAIDDFSTIINSPKKQKQIGPQFSAMEKKKKKISQVKRKHLTVGPIITPYNA